MGSDQCKEVPHPPNPLSLRGEGEPKRQRRLAVEVAPGGPDGRHVRRRGLLPIWSKTVSFVGLSA